MNSVFLGTKLHGKCWWREVASKFLVGGRVQVDKLYHVSFSIKIEKNVNKGMAYIKCEAKTSFQGGHG